MFNYYKRIAKYAEDLEQHGKGKRAEQIRDILKNENRCIFCGELRIWRSGLWKCSQCQDYNGEFTEQRI